MEKYIKILAETMDKEMDDPAVIQEFLTMSPNEVFEMVCECEGLCGYANIIKGWIADIYSIDLSNLNSNETMEGRC